MSSPDPDQIRAIRENLTVLRSRVDAAAARAGRKPSEVALVAVTKTHPPPTVEAARAAGLIDVAENYAQEFDGKYRELRDLDDLRWHFIGHLQSNKASLVVSRAALIQSVDREKIVRTIAREAIERGIVQDVLIQARLGDESSKTGAPLGEVPRLCEIAACEPGIRLRGLMGIAPLTEPDGTPAKSRNYFDKLKKVFDTICGEQCDILSIGMSDDYEEAIAAGSTMIRIGSALFGRRSS